MSEGKLITTKMYNNGGIVSVPTDTTELIELPQFVGETAKVAFSVGQTVSLGNYESVKIDVLVSLPCHLPEVADCYKTARKMVLDRLVFEVKTLPAWLKQKREGVV
jgi:hypothetical protein